MDKLEREAYQNNSLFDGPKFAVALWDDKRKRILFREELTEEEIVVSNQHYAQSLCPHLQYKKVEGMD